MATVLAASAALVVAGAAGARRRSASAASDTARSVVCQLVQHGYGPAGAVPLDVTVWVRGLRVPWSLAFLPGGDALVTEREGRVRYVTSDGHLWPRPIANVPLPPGEEGGLLGLAVDPAFDETGLVFVYRTSRAADGTIQNRVERWRLDRGDHHIALADVILEGIPAARFHDGGRLRFGPDRMLYVGTGDGGEPRRSGDLSSLGGKILRIMRDGGTPADNPWPNSPVYVRGIRNTQGFDWLDARTLYVTDNGPSGERDEHGHDEVDMVHPGEDLGWPVIAGCQARDGMIAPALSWVEAVPPGGALLYRGGAIPEWRGDLLIGTLASKHLHRVTFERLDPGHVRGHEVYLAGDPPHGFGRLRDVVQGPDGAVYVTTSNCDGRGTCPADGDYVLRIVRGR